jgi:vacuolar-type H+-ATPase subunit F/Vma7
VVNVKTAVVADEQTVNYLKLAGLSNAYVVTDAAEAEKRIRKLVSEPGIAIIITIDNFANRIQSTINEITENYEYPIIISIPTFDSASQLTIDPITELIKRKTGIELKV